MNEAEQPPVDSTTRWPASEQLAYQLAARCLADGAASPPRVLISSTSRGQAAAELAHWLDARHPASPGSEHPSSVTLYDFEHYRWRMMRESLAGRTDIRLVCAADPPADLSGDLAVLAIRRDWQAELSRELIQSFALRLVDSGSLVVVVDHPDDHWLGDQLREFSKSVKRATGAGRDAAAGATGYVVRAAEMRVRQRDFSSQFAFRDCGRLIQATSRPGVFSHRRLDLGARRLIDAMRISAGDRVLDIGCGSGVVGFAAALRAGDVHVTAIDSNTRAIACAAEGARINGIESRFATYLSSDGSVPAGPPFDVAVANPPYFANFKIADLFLDAANRAVRPGGRMWIVGKHPDWYRANVPRLFDRVQMTEAGGGYWVTTGTRPT